MIDLHCHILPAIDDGARDLDMSIKMARIAAGDGITTIACTPHVNPGLYDNSPDLIRREVAHLQAALNEAAIPIRLVAGGDNHLRPDFLARLRDGTVPTIANSRYFLFEPPHHLAPPRLDETVFSLIAAGYVPIITHPERLSWIDYHYDMLSGLVTRGAWMQVTAGSLTGRFGKGARYWAERLLDEGLVHVLASDAHDTRARPPILSRARDIAAQRLGDSQAEQLVSTRPQAVLDDRAPAKIDKPARPDVNQSLDGVRGN